MREKPDRLTEEAPYPGPRGSKGRHVRVHREIPENMEATALEELRKHLEEEMDRDLQETYELTDERQVCTFWTLENETEEVERRVEWLDWKLSEIKVPGEDE